MVDLGSGTCLCVLKWKCFQRFGEPLLVSYWGDRALHFVNVKRISNVSFTEVVGCFSRPGSQLAKRWETRVPCAQNLLREPATLQGIHMSRF